MSFTIEWHFFFLFFLLLFSFSLRHNISYVQLVVSFHSYKKMPWKNLHTNIDDQTNLLGPTLNDGIEVPTSQIRIFAILVQLIWGCIRNFPDWVDNEIYAYNNKHSLRSNTKGYGAKLTRMSHKTAKQLRTVTESFTICCARSRRPVRKRFDTPWNKTHQCKNVNVEFYKNYQLMSVHWCLYLYQESDGFTDINTSLRRNINLKRKPQESHMMSNDDQNRVLSCCD
jgi:hypothetical protein